MSLLAIWRLDVHVSMHVCVLIYVLRRITTMAKAYKNDLLQLLHAFAQINYATFTVLI